VLTFAFYQAKGGWRDWIIRVASRSQYSHVEYLAGDTCIGASKRDGGVVREKKISFRDGHWRFVSVPGCNQTAEFVARCEIGAKYNTISAILSVTPVRFTVGGGWHCGWLSAFLVNAASGENVFERPWMLTPGEFYDRLMKIPGAKQGPSYASIQD